LIGNKVEDMGIGRCISEKSFLDGAWVNELMNLDVYNGRFNNLDDRFKNDGIPEIIETIKVVI